jgi:hypothetical protein
MPAHGKVTAPHIQKEIVDEYLSGASVTQIAQRRGVSYTTVRHLLLGKGVLRHAADFPLKRFEASFVVTPGCSLWNRQLYPSGYGCFFANGRKNRAHRFSYEVYKGEIPQGLLVLHSCDNPRCVNPDHLRVGTSYDNTQDKISRNRWNLKKRASTNL